MPYYAELDGISGLALCSNALTLPSDFEINYDLFILANGGEDYFSAPFNGRGVGFLSSFVAFYESSQQVFFNYPSTGRPAINDIVNIRFTSTDNGDSTFTIRCYMSVNGGAEEQLNRSVGNDVFSTPLSPRPMEWGRRPNTLYRKVGVIRTRYYESGVIQNDWDFNQSSGNTAPDLVGSNPATLSGGFSWVFYGASTGVTADAAYTVNAPIFTSTASATLPAPTADVTFTVSAPTFAVSADATLPQPVADAAFTVDAPTFSASASVTTPGFNASVNFAITPPAFSASASVTLPSPVADIGYTVSAPTFNVSADASLPQPSSDASFTVSSPLFAATATATEPNFNASVNFTVDAPTFSGNASATLPQPVSDTNFTVSAPTFSVVAIVGGIAIIVDEETNINQRVLSNNISAPILSTNING